MSKNKKLNLTDLHQIDGKLHQEDASTFQPVTIAQVLGDTGLSKYSTLNLEEYKVQLNGMNLAELRSHATKVGIIPRDVSKERLTKQLANEFTKYVALYQKPSLKNRDVKPTKEILDIMSAVK